MKKGETRVSPFLDRPEGQSCSWSYLTINFCVVRAPFTVKMAV